MQEAKKREAPLSAICWILLGCVIAVWSATFPFGTREFQGPAILPFGSGLAMVLLGVILLIQTLRARGVVGAVAEGPEAGRRGIDARSAYMRVALTLGGMLAAALLFDLLGFILTMLALILFLLRAVEPGRWRSDIFYTVIFSLGSYLLFQILLKTTLPAGLLGF